MGPAMRPVPRPPYSVIFPGICMPHFNMSTHMREEGAWLDARCAAAHTTPPLTYYE